MPTQRLSLSSKAGTKPVMELSLFVDDFTVSNLQWPDGNFIFTAFQWKHFHLDDC
jgi:hypothetical protein